ncbi:IclR family transcriptional regulator [Natrinema salifodinae]|uniref:Transcriptional regulator, IclR family n=1 Tax=Natrinema salifodinae TaxID=1202768 RepID=A0A1I0QU90_9EURY|nr:IclR family transcriptional regulator [Natrinema salifodinae]SEW31185.1 transcriptional regulator, IclR family [Natrinema salifodinae]
MANAPNERAGRGNERSGRRIQSVEIAFTVLDAVRKNEQSSVTELAEELGHSKSTIHSHLQTLESQGVIVRHGDGYRLSLQVLDMANDVRDQVGNYEVIVDEVDKLAAETGEIAQFGLEERGHVAYLYKAMGNQAVETVSRPGGSQPMYSTSLGKAILAFLSPDRREAIIGDMSFTPKTPTTITDAEALSEELAAIADRGYAIDDEENIEGLRCVAAPVKSANTVLGAVSVTGPVSRITDDYLHGELADSVHRAANVIELNTKFS